MGARAAALAAALLALLAAPAAGWAHGGKEDALRKTPARALVQQSLALLAQEGKATEAHERVEAALKSRDREGVDLAKLRETQRAFDRGDHPRASRLLNQALAAGEMGEERSPGGKGDEMEMGEGAGVPAGQAPPAEDALEHAREFEPGRAGAEWAGLAVGAVLIAAAGALLLLGRRRRTAGA